MIKRILPFWGLILFFGFSITAFAQEETYRAKYIWSPDPFVENQVRFFRKTFELERVPETYPIQLYEDDSGTVYVNGQKTPNHRSFDAAPLLKPGKNVIAVEILNVLAQGCLAVYASAPSGGPKIYSDLTWKCADAEQPGWNTPDFDDSAWTSPRVVDELTTGVWRKYIDVEQFMDQDERERIERELAELKMRRADALARLAQEKPLPAKIEYVNGGPRIVVGERSFPGQIYNAGEIDMRVAAHRRRIERFGRQGVHLYGVHHFLSKYWTESGDCDFKPLIDNLIDMTTADPEARFSIMIRLDPPRWFVEKYPDENIGYPTGESSSRVDQIQRFRTSSFASEVFRREAGRLLAELIRQVESSPIAPRVFAYHPSYGVYTEWHYYGMEADMPDCGPAMTREFRVALRNKYGGDDALRQAWADPAVTLDTAEVPAPPRRTERGLLGLRDPAAPSDRRNLDYLQCHRDVWFDCLKYFNTLVKSSCENRALVGNYVAYFFGMSYPVEGWHQYQDRLLDSDFSDYQTAPTPYGGSFRGLGGPGGMRAVAESHRLRDKMHVIESDTRTHRAAGRDNRHSDNIEESLSLMARDFCIALTNGAAFWRFDFAAGWYDEPPMMELIGKTVRIEELRADVRSAAEVALVCDFESAPFHSYSEKLSAISGSLLGSTYRELYYAGAPFDIITTNDLALPNVRDYKVYVVLNGFYLDAAKRAEFESLKQRDKTLVWLYAPGLIDEKSADTVNMERVTGIKTVMIQQAANQTIALDKNHPLAAGHKSGVLPSDGRPIFEGPVFFIDDPEAEIFGTIAVGDKKLPALGIKKIGSATSVYSAIPYIDRTLLRNIFTRSGVHLYSGDDTDVVYACREFVALHTGHGGEKILSLPRQAKRITQMLPEEKGWATDSNEIRFAAEPNSTTLFRVEF